MSVVMIASQQHNAKSSDTGIALCSKEARRFARGERKLTGNRVRNLKSSSE